MSTVEVEELVSLARRPMSDMSAFSSFIREIDGLESLETLSEILEGILLPEDEDGSLSLAAAMYTSRRMAELFAPQVRSAGPELTRIMGMTVKFFNHILAAPCLKAVLQDMLKSDSLTDEELARIHLILGMAVAGPGMFYEYLMFLED